MCNFKSHNQIDIIAKPEIHNLYFFAFMGKRSYDKDGPTDGRSPPLTSVTVTMLQNSFKTNLLLN